MIVGGKITKVSAQKMSDDASSTGLGVDISVSGMEAKDGMLNVSYKYILEYQPKKAEMQMEGIIYYQGEDKKLSEMAEAWKKSKKLDPAFAEEILNSVAHTGMVAGTLLSFAIGVPAPIASQKLAVSQVQPAKKAG
ncbi:MAG: hypothetical protein V1708_05545 [Candidatus Micrarchaeota archaeon]